VRARYRHEIRFTGPEDASALIEAAEMAGFEVESAVTDVDESNDDLEGLRTRLADRRGEPSELAAHGRLNREASRRRPLFFSSGDVAVVGGGSSGGPPICPSQLPTER
jgi:hypothetical protein